MEIVCITVVVHTITERETGSKDRTVKAMQDEAGDSWFSELLD